MSALESELGQQLLVRSMPLGLTPAGRLGTRLLTRLVPSPQTYEVRGYAVCLRSPANPAVRTVLDAVRAVDEELAGEAGAE